MWRFAKAFVVAFVAALGASGAPAQQESVAGSHLALITAQPVSVKLKRTLGGADQAGNLILGNLYTVSLRSVRVVHGEFRARNVTLEMIATERDSIPIGREIFVLVDAGATSSPRAVYWGVAQRVACVPNDLVTGTGIGGRFDGFTRYDGSRCTSID